MKQAMLTSETSNGWPIGFSAREFMDFLASGIFSDMRVELVGGVLERMAPAYPAHSIYNATVLSALAGALAGLPVRLGVDLAVKIDDGTVRGADIAVVRSSIPLDGPASGADVLLVIEIADTTLSRDLGAKSLDYARAAIPAYWVVDLAARLVHVLGNPAEQGYGSRVAVRFGELLAVPGTDRMITLD